LYWPIFRQINPNEKEVIEQVQGLLSILFFGTMVLILPVITAGSLLPTWIFINSLQIIAHMVLIKTLMPGNAAYFLRRYLEWLRWYNKDLI